MSRRDSLSCLTVEQFLRGANWEGKLPEIHDWQQEESSQVNCWQCQTVENFFSQFNWSGQLLEQPRQNTSQSVGLPVPINAAIASPHNTLKRLAVKEFFTGCNWQGRSLEANPIWEQLDPYARLKQPVGEFFQFVPWEGEPEIGKLPLSATTFFQPKVALEPKFTDLSDLF